MDNVPEQNTPLNPDLAGYPNVEALVNGYRASGEEAKRLRERTSQLEGMVTNILSQQAANPRSVPSRSVNPEDRLTEFGVPVDALDAFVAGRVAKAFEPVARGMQARQSITNSHPEYVQFEQDVANYISSDPDLSTRYPRMFESDPAGAMEYAFLKFADSRRRSAAPQAQAIGGAVDASIPTSRAGEVRRAPDGEANIREAFDRYQKTGSQQDAQAYAKARLRSVITDDFLNT